MEAADSSTNSKVIVQFTDSSGLFQDVAPLLQNRLPLGNLHWKSPTRPLRSIEELDVSLDREEAQAAGTSSGVRRHQIPGLRQTPFVKVLLLRCDDKDKYKETVRKETKDWVKSLGFSTSGKAITKGQERHDAYEYIILHVVVPGTAAATQPKSSKHISVEATESTDSVNSKSKWTGKSTSTILDKLRADFSSSSKAPFERVAQVRLSDPSRPSGVLSPLEVEEQWQDFIEKLKTAILQSFDARVAQYEEDIKERESQRNLPGWNFCTFFILKEGLARGFENVGLLEDALQIYEELDLRLDGVIQDQANEGFVDAANALLPYSSDLKDTIRAVLDQKDDKTVSDGVRVVLSLQAWKDAEAETFPWKLERRNYQNMILTNQVSALDFRIYIFIRQFQIMLRRANMSARMSRSKSVNRQSGPPWDASLLSEICERSIKFMNLAARNLRQDLLAAWGGQEGLPEEESSIQRLAIDNIVASRKWSSLLQTLSDCQIITSLTSFSARHHDNVKNGELFSPTDMANLGARHEHSQSASTISSGEASNTVNGTNASVASDVFSALRIVKGSKTELLFWAAELFIMLRVIFLQLCNQSNTLPDLNKGSSPALGIKSVTLPVRVGLLAPSLRSSIHDEDSILGTYRLLTLCACQCYTGAGRSRSSRQLLFDLANLEAYKGDYEAAASWLGAIPGFGDDIPRTAAEHSMLRLYIDCLQKSNRHADVVQSLSLYLRSSLTMAKHGLDGQKCWEEMLEASGKVEAISLPLEAFFSIQKLDHHIRYEKEDPQPTMLLTLRALIPVKEMADAQVHLDCQSRGQHLPATLVFQHSDSTAHVVFVDNCAKISLKCSTTTEGWYDAVCLNVQMGNLNFKHTFAQDYSRGYGSQAMLQSTVPVSIYMYPGPIVPVLQARHAGSVDLTQKCNRISIQMEWGDNDIHSAQLELKPATAGLRLELVSARCCEGHPFEVLRLHESHALRFEKTSANSHTVLEIPYTLDDAATTSISIRATLRYESAAGPAEMYDNLTLTTVLPIRVNVQDLFQADATLFRFTFAPSRLVPISIVDCAMEAAGNCRVISAGPWLEPVDAFPKQPASWIVRTDLGRASTTSRKDSLSLTTVYRCVDEIILQTVLDDFSESCQNSPQAFAYRPLYSHLFKKLPLLWTEQEIELATLTQEVELWSFEELDWMTLLYAFCKHDRDSIESWLRQWHNDRAILPFRVEAAPTHTLRLLVEPPSSQIVITTELKCEALLACVVGQPIQAQLLVNTIPRIGAGIEITVEVTGQGDAWLVGGQRKATFLADTGVFQGSIVLVAQRTGSLIVPSIEVKCQKVGKDNTDPVAFEVEHLSSATTIGVRSNIQSTTIGVGDGEKAEGHWLIESQHVS